MALAVQGPACPHPHLAQLSWFLLRASWFSFGRKYFPRAPPPPLQHLYTGLFILSAQGFFVIAQIGARFMKLE